MKESCDIPPCLEGLPMQTTSRSLGSIHTDLLAIALALAMQKMTLKIFASLTRTTSLTLGVSGFLRPVFPTIHNTWGVTERRLCD